MQCNNCQNPLSPNDRFCQNCGNPRPTVDPKNVIEYRKIVAEFCEDGFLEEKEKQILAQMRQMFHISEQMHQEILAEFHFIDKLPIRIAYNTDTIKGYGAKQPCLVMIRVANLERMPLKKVQINYHLNLQKQELCRELIYVMPQNFKEVSLPFTPDTPGQYELFLDIDVETFEGEQLDLQSDAITFQVYPHHQPQQITINQSGERVYGNHSLQHSPQDTGKFLGSGSWNELSLRPLQKSQSGTKQTSKDIAFHIPPALQHLPKQKSIDLTLFLPGRRTRKLNLIGQSNVLFGKRKDLTDMRLALEPFKPEEGYAASEIQQNLRNTQGLISSVHLEIFSKDQQAWVQDMNSTNGTVFNQRALPPKKPTLLQGNDILEVGRALKLKVSLLQNHAGVILTRLENYSHKEHLILWDCVGFSDFSNGVCEDFDPQKHQHGLILLDGKLCMLNHSGKDWKMSGFTIKHGQAIPLQSGMDFEIGKATVIVD